MVIKTNRNKKEGVAILFAVLVLSVVLVVSLALMNITLKQLILSSVAKESQYALFAADSGLRCAKHWDTASSDRANPDAPLANPFGYHNDITWDAPDTDQITCGGNDIHLSSARTDDGIKMITQFTVVYPVDDRQTCAKITVEKSEGHAYTLISVLGYNLYGGTCPSNSDRVVERGLKQQQGNP